MSLFDDRDGIDQPETYACPPDCHCHCHRKESIQEKWAIELYKGSATQYRENKNNSISISNTHWLFLIPYALFKNFARIGNLMFLFIALLMLIDSTLTPYLNWIVIFPLLFYTFINVLKVVYLDLFRRRASHRVNFLKTRKGKKEGGGLDEDVRWMDLKPGDIIYLKKDEVCPADIVVLDTNLPKNKGMICWVDTYAVDGFTSYTMKKAVNATRVEKGSLRKDNFHEYRKILSGKVEYEAPSSDLTKFSGYLKLKKDPKAEHLSIENLVLRGSVIRNTDWVFGICVYTGHDTKIMRNSSYAKDKRSYFERVAERFFLFGAFLVVVCAVASVVVFLADQNQNEFADLYPADTNRKKLLYFLVLYSPGIPIALYGTIDLILLWRRASLQRRLHKIGKATTSSAKTTAVTVLDPNSLPNLGQVDYCFLDKTGTLTTGDYKIKFVYVSNAKSSKLYKLNTDIIQHRITEFRDKKGKPTQPMMSSVQSQNLTQIGLLSQTQPTQPNRDVNGYNYPKEQVESPVMLTAQGIDLDIADDPEFAPTYGVSNYYKFKEDVDTRTKQGGQRRDLSASASGIEVSQLPLLGSRTRNDEFISPKVSGKGEDLHEQPMSPNETTKLMFNLEMATMSGQVNLSKEDEKAMMNKIDLESPDILDKDKRVSFNVPDSVVHGAPEHKDSQENEFSENDYLIDYFTLGDRQIEEFTRSLAICHSARSRYLGDEYVYEVASSDELALLKFARLTGKSFVVSNRPDNPSEYTVKENGENIKYKILGVNDFTYSRKRFSVVYRAADDEEAIIYAKGPADNMKQALALDDKEMEAYDKVVAMFQERGYKAVAIGRRQMKDLESGEFYRKYQNYKMSLYNQTDDLEALAREVETGLKLVGIVALQDELRPEARETIKMLSDSDIKLWMLTGDNQENALNTGHVTQLLTKQIEVQTIKLDKLDDARALIKNILNTIKRHHLGDATRIVIADDSSMKKQKTNVASKTVFENSYKFAIAIDGDSFELIFKDPYLKANFTFICALCHTFIGYRFSPAHKKMVLSMVKKNFEHSPITMAIGDGLNDALMMRSADISIELRANRELLPNNAGDIQLTSLGLLKDIMLIDGRNISEKVEKTIHFAFYKSLVIGAPIFFFSYYNGFTGTPLYDSLLIFLYSFLFTFFPVLVYGGHDLSEPAQILLKFPALYIDGKKKKDNTWINFIVQSVVEGVIHAAIVYFGGSIFINAALSAEGYVSDLGMSSLAQYIAILIITNMKLYWLFKHKKILSFVLTFVSMACFVVYLFINDNTNLVIQDYLADAAAIFSRGGSFLTVLFVIIFSAALSYMIKHYIVERVYQTLYDWCAETNAGENIEEITNESIAGKIYKPKDLGAIVKNVYKQTELMDSIVQEMLSPADQNANLMGLRKYTLTFFDKRMEKQYKLITARKAKRSSQIIYALALLVYGGYSLGQSLLLKDDVYTFSRLGVFIGFVLFGFLLTTDFYRTQYFNVTLFYIFVLYVTKSAFDWTGLEDSVLGAAVLPLASQTLFKVSSLWLALLNLLYYVVFEIRIIIRYFAENDFTEFNNSNLLSSYSMISFALLLAGIFSIISSLGHIFEKDLRNEHSANANLEVQMNKSNDILSILLPKFIKDKIDKLGGDRNLAEDQGEVTILFCDIMDFDKIIQKEGKKVVNLLDYFFRVFDQYCGTHGIQKIETVGKTYMACAGLKSCEIGIAKKILSVHPTRRILNLALDIEEAAKQMKYGEGISMRIRIGIHYGRVIAGVIGYHKPQFSLIGDAVNTTSRVCTANNQGQIRMSDEAYREMMQGGGPGRSEIHFVSKVEEMKGKGGVKVHIVARNARSTSFKFKVGSAMQKFKEKSAEMGGAPKKVNPDLSKTTNQINVLNTIKQVLNLKEVVGDDPNKQNKQNSVQGTPSSSFIKTMKDEGEYMEYEDDDKDLIILKPNRYLLTLPSYAKQAAQEFEESLLSKKKVFQKGTMLALFVIYLFQSVFFLIIQDNYLQPVAITVLRVGFLVLLVLVFIFDGFLAKRRLHKPTIIVVFLFGTVISLLQAFWANPTYLTFRRIELIETMLIFLVATHGHVLDFLTSIIFSIVMASAFLGIFASKNMLEIESIFFFFTFIWANLMHVFRYFKMNIKFYNSLQLREKRKMEQTGLVSQLLPVHAAEKYFGDPTGRVDVSDEFEDVTIIYADIKGFTDYSAGVEAKDVVTMLSALFTRFDKVCHRYSLYKVYTIGDCYVVISFVNAANRDPGKEANNMVKMAMSMIEIIREVRKEIKFDELDMRIGIHTGNIIGGIVGTDIVRYDIWGQDVIIANAMESEGVKGHINVSEATKNLLERTHRGLYRFEPHKEVHLEKIGAKIPCYLLYSNQEYEEY